MLYSACEPSSLQQLHPQHHHQLTNLTNKSCTHSCTLPLAVPGPIPDSVARFHDHSVSPNQCCSTVVQPISAPIPVVWSLVRRFDNPQAYKHFVKSCDLLPGASHGDDTPAVGSLREVHLISGIPAVNSTERLEILDDERHVLSFRVVGGEHRLTNYRSVTTLHPCGPADTVVVESYVVDVPAGNTPEDTRTFVDTIVKCNLQSLARTVEKKKTATAAAAAAAPARAN